MILKTSVYHLIQALEYLLWASISLELSIPLMTVKHLPMIVTLYCAVCQCYYDNQAEVQAEVKYVWIQTPTDTQPRRSQADLICNKC